jgi:hypothetical protein
MKFLSMQTEFEFTLPRGYLDPAGRTHKRGSMRLATAGDEIQAALDARVQVDQVYLPVALLSRVITRLGDIQMVTPQIVEALFASDLAYLEDLYLRLNTLEAVNVGALCPNCNTVFQLQVAPLDQSLDEEQENQ